jgi:hypothetical protein
LGTLLVQIEMAWTHDRDADLPVRLAEEHPDLASDLLDFFDDLVLSSIGPPVAPDDRTDATHRLIASLRQAGKSALADAIDRSLALDAEESEGADSGSNPAPNGGPTLKLVSSPHRSDALLSAETTPSPAPCPHASYYEYADVFGHKLPQIAAAFDLPIGTAHTLIANGPDCPPKAQQEMARRGANTLRGLEYQAGLKVLMGNGADADHAFQKAASRSGGYSRDGSFSYEQAIRDAPSDFPGDKRAFWLSLADDPPVEI